MAVRASDSSHEFVDHAIRRTLDAPQLQFVLYSCDVWSDDSWSGDKVSGWWWRDGTELFTSTAPCEGTEMFVPDEAREGAPSFSAIRGPTRTTWKERLGRPPQYDCCFQRIEDAPSEPAGLAHTWGKVVDENIAYELTVPMLAITPMEILTALSDTGFELFDPPAGSRRPDRYWIRYSGVLRRNHGPDRSGFWKGNINVGADGFVRRLRLRWRNNYIVWSLFHADVARFTNRLLAELPDVVDLDALIATGSEVVMPAHPFDITSDVLGPLDDLHEPNHPGVYPDFQVVVEGPAAEMGPIAEAIGRAPARIMALTTFGRESTTDEEWELVLRFGIYGPSYASDPYPVDGGVLLYSDWQGEIFPDAANACLAIVVQELLAAGISRASIRPATD